jgi:hypothetical protein
MKEITTMTKLTMFSVAMLFVGGTATAAPKGSPLPKEIQDMECLVGKWSGSATMKMGPDAANLKITWDCHRASGEFAVQCKAAFKGIPGMPNYQESDLFGYDPGAKTYHWFSVTNAGETHDHQSTGPNGNKIEFVYKGLQEGKPFKEVINLTFAEDSKSLELVSETFVDGKSTSVLRGKATKN